MKDSHLINYDIFARRTNAAPSTALYSLPEFKIFKVKEISKSLNCYNNYKYDYFEFNKGKNYYGKKRRHYSDYS